MDNSLVEIIKDEHLRFAEQRGEDKTYCPSEIARSIFPNSWRDKMDIIRKVADSLIDDGQLVLMQKGQVINGKTVDAIGPIRLRKRK